MADNKFVASADFSPLRSEIEKTSQAWKAYARAQTDATTASKAYITELLRAQKTLDAQLRSSTNTLNKYADAQVRINTTTQAFKGDALRVQIEGIKDRTIQATAAMEGFSKIMSRAGSIALGIGISQGLNTIRKQFTEGIATATEYEKRISLIRTISQESQVSFNQLSEQIRNVSTEFNIPLLDAVNAGYLAVSNQVAKAAELQQFLATSANLARVADSSLTEAVNALSSVLKSYNLDASEASRISAILFKTADLGRVSLKNISDQIGTVTILSSQLGISFEEVGAALATFTVRGVTEANALTFLRNIMVKTLQPTDAMKQAISELGFTSAEAAVRALGLSEFMRQLFTTTNGTTGEIAQLFNSIRALQPALLFTGEAAKDFDKNLAAIKNSTDSFDKATQIATESAGFQWSKFFNKVKNDFSEFGQGIVDKSAEIINALTPEKADPKFRAFTINKETTVALNAFKDALEKASSNSAKFAAEARKAFGSLADNKKLVDVAKDLDKLDRTLDDGLNKSLNETNKELRHTEENLLSLEKRINAIRSEQEDFFTDSLTPDLKLSSLQASIQRVIAERDRLIEEANRTGNASLITGSFDQEAKKIKKIIDLFKTEFKDQAFASVNVDRLEAALSALAKNEAEILTGIQEQAQKRAEENIRKRYQLEQQLEALKVVNTFKSQNSLAETLKSTNIEVLDEFEQKLVDVFQANKNNLSPEAFASFKDFSIQAITQIESQKTKLRIDAEEKVNEAAIKALNERAEREKQTINDINKQRADSVNVLKNILNVPDLLKPLKGQDFLKANVNLELNRLRTAGGIQGSVVTPENTAQISRDLFDDVLKNILKDIQGKVPREISDIVATTQFDPKRPGGGAFSPESTATLNSAVKNLNEVSVALKEITPEIKKAALDNNTPGARASTDLIQDARIASARLQAAGTNAQAQAEQNAADVISNLGEQQVQTTETTVPKIIQIWDKEVTKFFETLPGGNNPKPTAPPPSINDTISNIVNSDGAFEFGSGVPTPKDFEKFVAQTRLDYLEQQRKLAAFASEFNNRIQQAANALDDFAGILKDTTLTTKQKIGQGLKTIGGVLSSIPNPYTQIIGGVASAGGTILSSKNFQKGGLVYLSAGGFAKGTDTVPAALTPGEMVMNRAATDRFYPMLRSMNSIQNFAAGGRVANNTVNIGDINISGVGSSNGTIDTTRLGNQLRRDIKNGKLGYFS